MLGFFKKFFDFNERELKRIRKKIDEINRLEDEVRHLKDEDFVKKTNELKEKVAGDKNNLDKVLPYAYALVREASRRVLGQRHFDVQLIAAVALHEGKIAEQKTGEGKTLSAVPALYLNALLSRGVHLVTVNDYLARRDAGWMGKIFYFLGLSTSSIISDRSFIYDPNFEDEEATDWRLKNLRPISRKEAYLADITYGINSEFGFDYLRDNMVQDKRDLVQRDFYFAVIDEADSVLIDEARTPHIISAPYEEDVSQYYFYAKIVRQLDPKKDYVVDEKLRTANLTEEGLKKVEKILGIKNIYENNFDRLYYLEAALKAATLFKLNKDYIVKDNEVIIVDEFTGRLLYGRRFSEGLHQAIEAKENVPIKQESKTLATVSLQNYFRMYEKLAGMTGTASTEAEEFYKIYKTEVLVVPTHRPMIRKDNPDRIYKTEKAKYQAVVEEIAKNYKIGRPVLVGTTSIEKNEYLSSLLKKKGIPHQVLNAKNHEKEAAIIAKAGEKYQVTVATNMAGRGVDIILGGDSSLIEKKEWQKKHDEVIKLKGLYVIGTERHESRRIDNQLRGRSGRQGDPGESTFFVSLEDDLMRIFGGEQISKIMTFLNFPEDQPLSHPMVSKAIEQAQIKVEGFNFDIRKNLVEYDDVLNKQREIVYKLRKEILFFEEIEQLEKKLDEMIDNQLNNMMNIFLFDKEVLTEEEKELFYKEVSFLIEIEKNKFYHLLKEKNEIKIKETLKKMMIEKLKKKINKKIKIKGEILFIFKNILLNTIDKYWMDHLTAIEDLREGINLRGYGQLDPLVEYKNSSYQMFEKLLNNIEYDILKKILRLEINIDPSLFNLQEKNLVFHQASSLNPFEQKEDDQPSIKKDNQPVRKIHKLGRNDPCWCGSGKKYKKCHYPN